MAQLLTRTMSSQVTSLLRDRILSGAYPPGAALLQDRIAAEFGVSQIPVREALVQLQGEGLVDIFAHRGFQVRPLSVAEFEEVFSSRLLIEPQVVVLGARKATPTHHEAARTALAKLDTASATKDLGSSGSFNRAFHLALIVPSEQPLATEVLGRMHTLSQRYIQLHLSPTGRVKRAARKHTAMYRAWVECNFKQASQLTRDHIAATRDDLARTLKEAG